MVVGRLRGADGTYTCPVCEDKFEAGNQLQFHYDSDHSVRSPDIVTTLSKRCGMCGCVFARKHQLYKHVGWKLNWAQEPKAELCRARAENRERQTATRGSGWYPVVLGPPRPPPEGWWIATDGSGQESRQGNKTAGWGVAIFRMPLVGDTPAVTLYGPVMTDMWDHRWLGAREKTNNTGELSAIGEAMLWLAQEAPDEGGLPVMLRYDSEYAANIALGRYDPQTNEELAREVKRTVTEVMEKRVITWQHVYGHTGAVDNEVADRCADLGARGEISTMSKRWAAPRGVYEARINVPEPVFRVQKPNRAAAWAKARAKARPNLRLRPAAAPAAAAKARAGVRAKAKAKAKGRPKGRGRRT